MGFLNHWIENNLLFIMTFFLVLTCLNLFLLQSTIQKMKKFRNLLRGNDGKDLETLLIGLAEKIRATDETTQNLLADFTNLKIKTACSFQKWGLIRFKAFENTGGDQSFAFALLDEAGNGVVISSLFGREETRVYCKPVECGVSSYPLSHEEKGAIQKALGMERKK